MCSSLEPNMRPFRKTIPSAASTTESGKNRLCADHRLERNVFNSVGDPVGTAGSSPAAGAGACERSLCFACENSSSVRRPFWCMSASFCISSAMFIGQGGLPRLEGRSGPGRTLGAFAVREPNERRCAPQKPNGDDEPDERPHDEGPLHLDAEEEKNALQKVEQGDQSGRTDGHGK